MISVPTRLERGVYSRDLNGFTEYGSRCDEIDGRTRWVWGFRTIVQARHSYQERRQRVRQAHHAAGQSIPTRATIKELVAVYLPTIQDKRASIRTITIHLSWWASHFKSQPVLTLTARHVERGMTVLKQTRSGPTVNRYASSLRRLMNKLVKPASWVLDLWRDVEFYPERTDALPPLKDDQEDRLLAKLGYPDALYVRLALLLGLRRAEFFRLRWEWVWWEEAILKIPGAKRHVAINLPLPEEAVAILQVLWKELKQPDEGWVFPLRQQMFIGIPGQRAFKLSEVRIDRRHPINSDNWYRQHYRVAVKKAGLPNWVTFHTLRRTWATRTGATTPARILQLLGRWKNMKTAERYCSPFDDSLRAAMQRGAERKVPEKSHGENGKPADKPNLILQKQRSKLA